MGMLWLQACAGGGRHVSTGLGAVPGQEPQGLAPHTAPISVPGGLGEASTLRDPHPAGEGIPDTFYCPPVSDTIADKLGTAVNPAR